MIIQNAPAYTPAGSGLAANYSISLSTDLQTLIPLQQSFNGSPVFARTMFVSNLSAGNTLEYSLNNVSATVPPYSDAYIDITGYTFIVITVPAAITVEISIFDYSIPPGFIQRGSSPLSLINDPQWANVVGLYHFEGQNTSKQVLNSKRNLFDTLTGGLNIGNQIDTSQFKFGNSSVHNFGSFGGDCPLILSASISSIFTIEFFYKGILNGNGNGSVIAVNDNSVTEHGPSISIFHNNTRINNIQIKNITGQNSSQVYLSYDPGGNIVYNEWNFFAFVVINNIVHIYINGVFSNSVTVAPAANASSKVTLNPNAVVDTLFFMDELRITSTARYLTNFTPPDEPFSDQ